MRCMRLRRFGLLSLLLVPIGVVAALIRRRRRTRPGGGFGGGGGGPDAGVREARRPGSPRRPPWRRRCQSRPPIPLTDQNSPPAAGIECDRIARLHAGVGEPAPRRFNSERVRPIGRVTLAFGGHRRATWRHLRHAHHPVDIDEGNRQRNKRLPHVEARAARAGKHEQHPGAVRERGPIHETEAALGGGWQRSPPGSLVRRRRGPALSGPSALQWTTRVRPAAARRRLARRAEQEQREAGGDPTGPLIRLHPARGSGSGGAS